MACNENSALKYDRPNNLLISVALLPAVLFESSNHPEISSAVILIGCDLSKIKLFDPMA